MDKVASKKPALTSLFVFSTKEVGESNLLFDSFAMNEKRNTRKDLDDFYSRREARISIRNNIRQNLYEN